MRQQCSLTGQPDPRAICSNCTNQTAMSSFSRRVQTHGHRTRPRGQIAHEPPTNSFNAFRGEPKPAGTEHVRARISQKPPRTAMFFAASPSPGARHTRVCPRSPEDWVGNNLDVDLQGRFPDVARQVEQVLVTTNPMNPPCPTGRVQGARCGVDGKCMCQQRAFRRQLLQHTMRLRDGVGDHFRSPSGAFWNSCLGGRGHHDTGTSSLE
jgi:hypothetical protein